MRISISREGPNKAPKADCIRASSPRVAPAAEAPTLRRAARWVDLRLCIVRDVPYMLLIKEKGGLD